MNFSERHSNYFDAWSYVRKEDTEFLKSENHPDLSSGYIAHTKAATDKKKECGSGHLSRKRSFDAVDLSDVILAKKIKNKSQLLKFVYELRQEEKRDLPLYVLNNIDKSVKLIKTTWEMESAVKVLERAAKTRMDILHEVNSGECVMECGEMWLQAATETLTRNNVTREDFSREILGSLVKGRGKHRNILIIGPANCGKTFMLNPLCEIYDAFINPATNSFAWIGADKKEIIFLDDLRWSDKLIAWNNFLQLLEGGKVHISAPKNLSPEDVLLEKDTPIFATSISEIRKYENGIVNEQESEMMDVLRKIFKFSNQFLESQVRDIKPCGRCFSELVLIQPHENFKALVELFSECYTVFYVLMISCSVTFLLYDVKQSPQTYYYNKKNI